MAIEGYIDPNVGDYESKMNVESEQPQADTPEKKGLFARMKERASKMAESVSTFGRGISEKISDIRDRHDAKLDSKFHAALEKIGTGSNEQSSEVVDESKGHRLDKVAEMAKKAVSKVEERVIAIDNGLGAMDGKLSGYLTRQAEVNSKKADVDASQKSIGAKESLIKEFQNIIRERMARFDSASHTANYAVLNKCYEALRTGGSSRANEVLNNADLPDNQRVLLREILTKQIQISELADSQGKSQADLKIAQIELKNLRERRSGTAKTERAAAPDLVTETT